MSYLFDGIKKNNFLVIGRAGMDLYPDPPGAATEEAVNMSVGLGGSSANIAAGICKLGGKSALVTRVSDDSVGRYCVNQLKHYGVDVSNVKPISGEFRNSLAVYESRVENHQSVIYRNGAADFQMGIDDIKAVKEKANEYKEYNDAYKKYVRLNEDQLHRLSDTELRILESHDYNPPSIAFPDLKYKFPPVNIVILDDLLGSDIFSRKSKSIFQNALIKSRHLNIAFQILVQSMKAVPKPVRLNCSIFWLGKFSAMNTILTDIADEVSGVVSKDELEMLYKYAIDKEHGALVIDTTKPKNCWFSANWDTMLQISE